MLMLLTSEFLPTQKRPSLCSRGELGLGGHVPTVVAELGDDLIYFWYVDGFLGQSPHAGHPEDAARRRDRTLDTAKEE